MVKIKRLSERDMEELKNKKILFYSNRGNDRGMIQTLRYFNIEIVGHYAEKEEPTKWQILKGKYKGVPYINEKKIEKMIREDSDMLVLVISSQEDFVKRVNEKVIMLGGECSQLSSGMILNSFGYLNILKKFKNPIQLFRIKIRAKEIFWKKTDSRLNAFVDREYAHSIIICSPPKTGDHTLQRTFEKINEMNENNGIHYINTWHRPENLNKNKLNRKSCDFKIIIGLREPISTNISQVFHRISEGYNPMMPVLDKTKLFDNMWNKMILNEYEEILREKGDNTQILWDMYLECYMNSNQEYCRETYIQFIIPRFQKYVLDILSYPFDKEKGYAIVKEGNIEVFVYQLEKLNGIVPELSEFVGVPFDTLTNGNVGTNKWSGELYKQFLKEVEITQEYLDKCYDEPYVKHCYSEEDIEKFKERWRPHIKK